MSAIKDTNYLSEASHTNDVVHAENTMFDVYLDTYDGGLEDVAFCRVCADTEEEAVIKAIIGEGYGFDSDYEEDAIECFNFIKKSLDDNGCVEDTQSISISLACIVPLQEVTVEFPMDGKMSEHTIFMPLTSAYTKSIMQRYIS